jgi:hypothetical protein
MKKNRTAALGVALLGMDERSCNLLRLFFKRTCEGFAHIVEEAQASVDIIDTYCENYEQLLEHSLARTPSRAIVVLTSKAITRIEQDNLLYLNKPIKVEEMMEAIDWAKDLSHGSSRHKPFFSYPESSAFTHSVPPSPPKRSPVLAVASTAIHEPPILPPPALNKKPVTADAPAREAKKHIDLEEQKKKAKYRSAITVDEHDFNDIIGRYVGLDLNSTEARYQAVYNTKHYYQSYVQIAYQACQQKLQTLQLNCTICSPLIILPHSNEVWINTNDRLLKEISGVWLNPKNISITPVDKIHLPNGDDVEKIQEMGAFLWKLALWTSKGRYPATIDIDNPIYLQHWPDFTRYIVTPHALRISSLLVVKGPDTLINIAQLLNIELRYVYVFISAAHALGLVAQATRQMDILIKPTLSEAPPAKKSLWNSIIAKLRSK